MNKKDNRILLLTTVLCLLPIIMALMVYRELPAQIAIHWSLSGDPDRFVPKAAAAFGLPFLFAVINIFSKLRLYGNPHHPYNPQAMTLVALWLPPVLALLIIPGTFLIAIGVNISIPMFATLFMGTVFVICGNYLPKTRYNDSFGFKLPWTRHSVDNWNKTHRLAGYLWILCGTAAIIGTFLSKGSNGFLRAAVIMFLLVNGVLPSVYSYVLYNKERKDEMK